MHLQFYLLLLSLFFVLPISAQQKQIEGDTAYWFARETRLVKKLELRDLSRSSISFEFRFSNGHQFVEMWETSDTLAGVLTSYTMKLGKKYDDPDIDTLFIKTILPREDLEKIKSLLDENEMAELPSQDEIEGWGYGFDGITYGFQFSSPEKLINNTYWTPQIYDTLPEAEKVLFVVDSISNLFNLKSEYENLFKSVPQKGSYQYSSTSIFSFPVGGKRLGYFGSLKMPLGLSYSSYFRYIGNKKTNLSLDIEGRINTKRDYNLDFSLRKWNVFFKDNKKISGSISFLGRERRIETIDFGEKTRSTNLAYLLSLSKLGIGIGAGISHVFMPEKQTGFYFTAGYAWQKTKLYFGSRISIFSDRKDYYFHLQKNIKIDNSGNNLNFRVRIFSESFRGFFDTGLSVSVNL